jgi:hypothetical protein
MRASHNLSDLVLGKKYLFSLDITIEIRRGGNHPRKKATWLFPVALIDLLRHFVFIFIIGLYAFAAKDSTPICCLYTAVERKGEVNNCWEKNGNQDPYPYGSSWITDTIQRKSHPPKQDCYDKREHIWVPKIVSDSKTRD